MPDRQKLYWVFKGLSEEGRDIREMEGKLQEVRSKRAEKCNVRRQKNKTRS